MAYPPDAVMLKKLDEIDWGVFRPQMIAYAAWLAENHYGWRGSDTEVKGQQLIDLVDNIIEKLYSGTRAWPHDRVPSLKTWFKKTVQSEMYALMTSKGVIQERGLDASEESGELEVDATEYLAVDDGPFEYAVNDPEKMLIDKQHREEIEAALYRAADEDPELEALIFGMLELGDCKPQLLEQHLGLSIKDVNNRLRRLRARNPRIKKELDINND